MNQAKLDYIDRPSWLNQMGSFIAILILTLMPFFFDMPRIQVVLNMLLASLLILAIIYNRYTWQFRISNDDVQSRHGIITCIEEQSISLKGVRDIQVKQTIIQRMVDVGDVEFTTAGDSNAKMVFAGIKSPFSLRDKVLRQQSKKAKKTKK
ncbi:MAG: PH domain-containing protein [Mariprofundaceae bacterium]|nr:PH domain-containing protein [Mariprofundaceae bacterium]